MHPLEAIQIGRQILDPVLLPAGFDFRAGKHGSSSGGTFAQASYDKGDKRLTFSFRHKLGQVTYHVGDRFISHQRLMQYLSKESESEYARFSHDAPEAGFAALKHDLEHYCQDFLRGEGDTVRTASVAK
jgi:hypothetical protein